MRRNIVKVLCILLTCATVLSAAFFVSCRVGEGREETAGISFTDALGREITVKKNPERVAALLGSFADVWMLAGGELCAAAEDAWEDFGLSTDAVNIGGAHSPDLETLISTDPDFVIASASTASNVAMKDALEAMGITVAYFAVDDFDDYLRMLEICTDITGRKDLYEKNGAELKAQIEGIKAQYQNASVSEKERRVLLLRASSGTVKAKGSRGTILGEMLADLGCVNVADRDASLLESLSVEAILREEPHHVFVVTMGNDTEKAMRSLENMLKENPAWQSLAAIREGRLHLMDKTLFNLKPNSRWAEAYEILYETIMEQ